MIYFLKKHAIMNTQIFNIQKIWIQLLFSEQNIFTFLF